MCERERKEIGWGDAEGDGEELPQANTFLLQVQALTFRILLAAWEEERVEWDRARNWLFIRVEELGGFRCFSFV